MLFFAGTLPIEITNLANLKSLQVLVNQFAGKRASSAASFCFKETKRQSPILEVFIVLPQIAFQLQSMAA